MRWGELSSRSGVPGKVRTPSPPPRVKPPVTLRLPGLTRGTTCRRRGAPAYDSAMDVGRLAPTAGLIGPALAFGLLLGCHERAPANATLNQPFTLQLRDCLPGADRRDFALLPQGP